MEAFEHRMSLPFAFISLHCGLVLTVRPDLLDFRQHGPAVTTRQHYGPQVDTCSLSSNL